MTAVVVGVDGSPESRHALDWAVDEAVTRDHPLRIVHAFVWPLVRPPLNSPITGSVGGPLYEEAQQILDDAAEHARQAAPGLEVITRMPACGAAAGLLAASRDAALVVVGNRGLGGFTGLLIGSVGVQLAAHAACPVVVARRTAHADGNVGVGVDDTPEFDHVLRFAFEEAAAAGVGLTAVHAVGQPEDTGCGHRMLEQALSRWRGRHPSVTVTEVVLPRPARQLLITESYRARLVVVGSRGRGGFTGLLLGSVSQAVLHHAHCPVAVVRPLHEPRPG